MCSSTGTGLLDEIQFWGSGYECNQVQGQLLLPNTNRLLLESLVPEARGVRCIV